MAALEEEERAEEARKLREEAERKARVEAERKVREREKAERMAELERAREALEGAEKLTPEEWVEMMVKAKVNQKVDLLGEGSSGSIDGCWNCRVRGQRCEPGSE